MALTEASLLTRISLKDTQFLSYDRVLAAVLEISHSLIWTLCGQAILRSSFNTPNHWVGFLPNQDPLCYRRRISL